jgi:opacity protein-like surface antigen
MRARAETVEKNTCVHPVAAVVAAVVAAAVAAVIAAVVAAVDSTVWVIQVALMHAGMVGRRAVARLRGISRGVGRGGRVATAGHKRARPHVHRAPRWWIGGLRERERERESNSITEQTHDHNTQNGSKWGGRGGEGEVSFRSQRNHIFFPLTVVVKRQRRR